MSTFWIHRESGTVAVDDAVLKGVDTSSLPTNIQLVWWYGANGEIRYTDEDRLPIREPVTDLEPFIPVFNKWITAAKTPLPTTSGKTMPAITLAQAKSVKIQLTRGLYNNKFAGLSGSPPDNTASVNASITELTNSTNNAVQSLAQQVNNFTLSSDGARSADAAALNTALNTQASGMKQNYDNIDFNTAQFNLLRLGLNTSEGINMGGVQTPQMSVYPVGGGISAPSVTSSPVSVGGGYTDPLAPTRDYHINQINAQTTVDGVAAYDITAGW